MEEGLERDEPVLVMVGSRKLELLRQALGERAADVHFADMEVIGRNPARIIPAWGRFVADHAGDGGGGMRGIGEPIWADRKPDELDECQLHESLINLAFAAADSFRLICPYDTAALPGRRDRGGTPQPPDRLAGGRTGAVRRLLRHREGGGQVLRAAAGAARRQRGADAWRSTTCARLATPCAGVPTRPGWAREPRTSSLAVNEVLSNSLHHAEQDGTLRIWDEPDGLVCEVRDGGHIEQPLIGREEPVVGQVGGHGIWLVNLVCDLVQVRSSPSGSTVRMKMSPA